MKPSSATDCETPSELVSALRHRADAMPDDFMIERSLMQMAADRLDAAETRVSEIAEFEDAKAVIAEANNSLYGSHGYFLSSNGGPADKYHLAKPIEKLKAYGNEQWRRAEKAEALLSATAESCPRCGYPEDK